MKDILHGNRIAWYTDTMETLRKIKNFRTRVAAVKTTWSQEHPAKRIEGKAWRRQPNCRYNHKEKHAN